MAQLLSIAVLAGVALALPAAQTLRQPIFVDIETTATAPAIIFLPETTQEPEIISIPKEPEIIFLPEEPELIFLPETTKKAEIVSIPKEPTIIVPTDWFPFPPKPTEWPRTTRELVVRDTNETTSASDSITPTVTDTTTIVTDTTPTVTDTTPTMVDTTPIVVETTPIVDETTAIEVDIMTRLKKIEPCTTSLTSLLPWKWATKELLKEITSSTLLKTMSNMAKPATTEKPAWEWGTQQLFKTLYSSAPTDIPSWVVGVPLPTKTASE